MSVWIAAMDRHCFVVELLREIEVSQVGVQICKMANGVSDRRGVTALSALGDGLLVVRQRCFMVATIPFDLAQKSESLDEVRACIFLTAPVDQLQRMLPRIVETPFPPRLVCEFSELLDISHRK